MQVKKFEAPTMQEALKVIKREVGPEAIILSTKQLKSGFGLMSKESVEVTVAISDKDIKKKNLAEKGLPQNVKEKIWGSKAETQSEIYNNYFEKQLKRTARDRIEIGAAKDRQRAADLAATFPKKEPAPQLTSRGNQDVRARQNTTLPPPAKAAPVVSPKPIEAPSVAPVNRERRYIDITDDEEVAPASSQQSAGGEKVKTLERDMENLKSMFMELASGIATKDSTDGENDLTQAMLQVNHNLLATGIEKKSVRSLLKEASFELNEEDKRDEQAILDRVASEMMKDIHVKDLLAGVGAVAGVAKTKVLVFVGPTGVGKTTTIAKIASMAILKSKLRVGLINLDSYKVAAADQLGAYAGIMNLPFRSISSANDLAQAVYDFSSLDLVLIDTTGRSQKDQESLSSLKKLLSGIDGIESVLMISATTKETDVLEQINRFQIFDPTGMIVSKLDETGVYGSIFNIHIRSKLPLYYFTVGQRVPEDIEKATPERVVDLILDL